MRQFYEAYRRNEKVSPLVRQLPWTHHLIILSQAKPPETREFNVLAALKARWTKRELERQIQSGAVLRSAPAAKKVSPAVTQLHPTAMDELKNAYSLEFLSIEDGHSEAALHGAMLRNLGRPINATLSATLPPVTPPPPLASLPALAARRALIHDALTDAGSYKLQRAGTDVALAAARKAYALAEEEPALGVWSALAAYRLAHLVMRQPRTPEVLHEADALFAEAGRHESLGPYPHVYRLAVLHHLAAPPRTVEAAFKRAVDAYAIWTRPPSRAARTDADRSEGEPSEDALLLPGTIQTELFALLELSGYFLGLAREPLDGRGARLDEPVFQAPHWRLVGPDPTLGDVLVSKATADAELLDLAPRVGAAFVFRLPPNRNKATLTVGEGAPSALPHRAARLLACLLRHDARDTATLTSRVMGEEGSGAAFRQVKARLRQQLEDAGVALPAELIVDGPAKAPRLAPSIVALGAVSEQAYLDRD